MRVGFSEIAAVVELVEVDKAAGKGVHIIVPRREDITATILGGATNTHHILRRKSTNVTAYSLGVEVEALADGEKAHHVLSLLLALIPLGRAGCLHEEPHVCLLRQCALN
jgi:hypothetical protein